MPVKLGGTQIGDLHLPQVGHHWKKLLFALMEDLSESNPGLCVFFWDELPLFVYNVKQAEGEAAAMEVLDVLRSIRQRHSAIRMVFAGSIGLHQVLSGLRKTGYANDPTNDMRTVEVPPLDPNDGATLAKLLLVGEGLQCGVDTLKCAEIVSNMAGHIPFYIHSLVARLTADGGAVSEEGIRRCLGALLTDPNDPAHFQYYRDRIRTYYGDPEAAIALAALDALCQTAEPMLFGEMNRIRHQIVDADQEVVRDTMRLLGRDHYLHRTEQGQWGFRYEIVRRWWHIERG